MYRHVLISPGYRSWFSDLLQIGRSGDRIPLGARFSTHIQAGTGVHPATGSFPEVKQPGQRVDHPPVSSAEVKERVNLYFYFTSGP